jgi:hypothetical protein
MWKQLQGTAMGTPLAIAFANIYMTEVGSIKGKEEVSRSNSRYIK